ncbi:hypothetical protein [Nocardioides dongxiaopingii]|jgi:hypothetical protein|uniref:hypothetical protein n=1 Tax=Nocardioides dongxiaopingii TaxID=2576036 RepID=UPI0010C77076|nr:hypothetical protein [Nocardioides dongxiaopingii]
MGLLSKMLGGRPGASVVTQTVRDAVRVLPGVVAQDLTYNHQQNASGALSGTVDVLDTPTFLEVLRTVHRVLDGLLGDGANRVTFYLAGRTPDGAAVTPGDLGLSQPPTGREIAQRLRL